MADENQPNEAAAQPESAQGPQFSIQRIYTKDISFEAPNSPAMFQKEWKPEVQLDLDTKSNPIGENLFEVVLSVTVTAKIELKSTGARFNGGKVPRLTKLEIVSLA